MRIQARQRPYKVGDRVALCPSTDSWMRGDKYGEVISLSRGERVRVKLDSGRIVRFHESRIVEVIQ